MLDDRCSLDHRIALTADLDFISNVVLEFCSLAHSRARQPCIGSRDFISSY
jgi:hypothetical protein